jgi:protein-disulfide isomerase
MNDHMYVQRIREQQQRGRDSGVRSTPTFVVDGTIHDVSFGLARLVEAVEALLPSQRHSCTASTDEQR